MLYSITAGPMLQPLQTSHVFNSLPPGNYVVTVTDGSGNHRTANAVITGNYTAPDFNPVPTPVTCRGSADGKITGNMTAGTGYGPYTWQLIAPSPKTTPPQSSDVFTGLAPGNYTLRLTDACGNFRTEVVSIVTPVTDFFFSQLTTVKVGCDSMYVQAIVRFNEAIRLPITLTYTTKTGTVTMTTFSKVDSSYLRTTTPYIILGNVLPGITYGDHVSITARNACGDTRSISSTIYPYTFYPRYLYGNCNDARISFYNTTTIYHDHGLMYPVTATLTDVATNTLVESRTFNDIGSYFILAGAAFLNNVTVGKTYQFSITDGCGRNFTQNYTIPARGIARIVQGAIHYSPCIDSVVGTYRVETTGFATDAVLTITSGPANFGSTKPEYAYQESYTYPISYPISGNSFFLNSMPPGTYHYTITDGCGNTASSSIVIKKTDVGSLSKSVSYKKGCLGKNVIYYTRSFGIVRSSDSRVIVKNITTGTVLSQKDLPYQFRIDSILNVPSGQYEITFMFGKSGGKLLDGRPAPCAILKDTITIEGYENPEIYTGNSILCNNNITLQVVPDSSKGVLPYQFEVISGPQSFPVQSNPLFTVHSGGIYTVRIYDMCGNATAKQIEVSPIQSPLLPISVVKTCDVLRLKYPSSLYYRYQWTRPNGTVFLNDSLILDPITPADTGTYQIIQTVSINGCNDSKSASYHVALNGTVYNQQATICAGNSLTIGGHVYTTPGVYNDTLVSQLGCDSIIRLTLQATDYKRNTINATICNGQRITVGSRMYTLPGTYHDTLATSTCDSIITLRLSISSPVLNLGGDRIICPGQALHLNAGPDYIAYYWNDNYSDTLRQSIAVNQAGRYWVQAKNSAGCTAADTVVLSIQAPPVANAGKDTSICSGEAIKLVATGGMYYQWLPGGISQPTLEIRPLHDITYYVIVSDAHGCRDTAGINIYVKPSPATPVFDDPVITHCLEESPVEISPAWGRTFLWTATGNTHRSLEVTEPGTYEVKVQDSTGCWSTGSITIEEHCAPKLFVPSAFSPNDDGVNDHLEIFGKYYTDFKITIFNRWGEIIFISSDPSLLWDGNYREIPMEIGTYPWTVRYKGKYNNEEYQQKGSVTLIR